MVEKIFVSEEMSNGFQKGPVDFSEGFIMVEVCFNLCLEGRKIMGERLKNMVWKVEKWGLKGLKIRFGKPKKAVWRG